MLEIRRVRPGDLAGQRLADEVLAGEDVVVRVGRSGFSLAYTPAVKAEWRIFAQDERVESLLRTQDSATALFAAGSDGELAGIAVVHVTRDGWGELLDLRVDSAQRRQGVGTELLSACQQFAVRQGMGGLRAAVPDTNPVMCQFLEHHRFQLHGMDRMALSLTDTERTKPLQQRACLLWFYRSNEKG